MPALSFFKNFKRYYGVNMRLKNLFIGVIIMVSAYISAAELKVLTIGNSFADSVFVYLPQIAAAMPDCKLVLERANLPGCSLKRHWELVEKSTADETVKPYNGKSLKEILQSEKWDYVTLQQASPYSWREESYQPYLSNLLEFVHTNAPTAEVVLQQTWCYRFDDPRLAEWQITPVQMYQNILACYNKFAAELKLRQIPTGYAVNMARETQDVKFKEYDLAAVNSLQYPAELPDQTGSLVNGIWWGKGDDGSFLLRRDAYHLNKRGQYLQACLWFEFLFKTPATKIEFAPPEITPEDAGFLRETAHQSLLDFKQVNQ